MGHLKAHHCSGPWGAGDGERATDEQRSLLHSLQSDAWPGDDLVEAASVIHHGCGQNFPGHA